MPSDSPCAQIKGDEGDRPQMMFAVFATMVLALGLGWFGRRSLALFCVALCLAVAIWEFLFEIYSPETGFSMPWIQTELQADPPVFNEG